MGLFGDFSERMAELQEESFVHGAENLDRLASIFRDMAADAQSHLALFPYLNMVGAFCGELDSLRIGLNIPEANSSHACATEIASVRFLIPRCDFPAAVDIVNSSISDIGTHIEQLEIIKKGASDHISLTVLPNKVLDGKRAYLKQGRLIMSVKDRSGVHTFRIVTEDCDYRGFHVDFESLALTGEDSVERAMELHVGKLLGTVAIAKNTGYYPLFETTLPILKEKYEAGIRRVYDE